MTILIFSKLIPVNYFYQQDILISNIGSDCRLQILDVYPEDEGQYTCTATNTAGETSTSCYIAVEGELAFASAPFLLLLQKAQRRRDSHSIVLVNCALF